MSSRSSMRKIEPSVLCTSLQPQPFSAPNTTQPSYAHTMETPRSEHGCYEGMMSAIGLTMGLLGSVPCLPCCCFNPYQIVPQGNVGLVSRFGRYYRSVDPGLYFVNSVSETLSKVDIKIRIESIPRQQVMTKDNVGVLIDSTLYWHIVDPYVATYMVQDVQRALIERTMTTMRQIIGTRTLQASIESRDTIAHEIQDIIAPAAVAWGVKIESILLKDLIFTADLQETLAAAAKQRRVGESKVISAKAEVDAAKLMREASDILNTPAAMQIRYLETMADMAKSSGTKVIFMPSADGNRRPGDIAMAPQTMAAKEAALFDQM
ncbi:hypothetical protein QVD99_003667 [Batrachochytrium dendrobatidis]|nr:hypothetical protein O5D80_003975 [Batrachochytrium dendrobatidis]KAK5669260.1 hypothetical protein QVD99_003667 [Batrachochytrium dendrobatidis]